MNAYQLFRKAQYEDIVGRGYDPLKLAKAIGEPDEPRTDWDDEWLGFFPIEIKRINWILN